MPKRVIIVDDSKFLTKSIQEFLESQMGYDVVAIGHNGKEAIDLYKQHKPDLVTMDITMPDMDGVEALINILSVDPKAKVIMMSAVRGEVINDCIKGGAMGFISKPLKFSDPEFVESVKETLNDVLE